MEKLPISLLFRNSHCTERLRIFSLARREIVHGKLAGLCAVSSSTRPQSTGRAPSKHVIVVALKYRAGDSFSSDGFVIIVILLPRKLVSARPTGRTFSANTVVSLRIHVDHAKQVDTTLNSRSAHVEHELQYRSQHMSLFIVGGGDIFGELRIEHVASLELSNVGIQTLLFLLIFPHGIVSLFHVRSSGSTDRSALHA